MKMLLRILTLVALLLLGLALSGCSALGTLDFFEVDDDVTFGNKVEMDDGILFPTFMSGGDQMKFEFQCNEDPCTLYSTSLGLPEETIYGIPLIPFFPTKISESTDRRVISMFCSEDFPEENIPNITVHTPQESITVEGLSVLEKSGSKNTKRIMYIIRDLEKVEFDKFQMEFDEKCDNLIIPFKRRKVTAYVPLAFPRSN